MERKHGLHTNYKPRNIAVGILLTVAALASSGCGKTAHGMPTLGDCGEGKKFRTLGYG